MDVISHGWALALKKKVLTKVSIKKMSEKMGVLGWSFSLICVIWCVWFTLGLSHCSQDLLVLKDPSSELGNKM